MLSRTTPVLCALLPGLISFLALAGPLQAQSRPTDPEMGRPQVRNWTMRDYEAYPQNWVVRRDAEGRLYFGNRDGVLMYDGQGWRTLPMPGLFVRGLDFAADGRLYAGAVDELGYFERTALGEWGAFVSLRDHLPAEERAIADIRSVRALPDGVFFATAKRLLRWHDGKFKIWRLDGEWSVFSYRVGEKLYLHRMQDALRVVSGDELKVAVDLPQLQARLAAVLPWTGEALLLIWPNGECAVWQDGQLTPWAEASRAWLSAQEIAGAQLLSGGRVAIRTARDGVVLFDEAGNFLQRIDAEAGLYNSIVRDVLLDGEGGLWFAMNHGVAHVDALAGVTFFDAQNGLSRSTVRAVTRHDGVLHAATAEGVFRLRPADGATMARFEFMPGTDDDTLALHSHRSGLLVGTRLGVYLHTGNGGARELLTSAAYQLSPRPGRPDEVWAAGSGGVYPLSYDGSRWRVGEPLLGPVTEARTLAELPDGSLWISTPTRGLLRWREPTRAPVAPPDVFFESAGLPTGHNWMRIVRWRDALMASSSLGLYRWEPNEEQFKLFPVAGAGPGEGSRNIHGGDPEHLWSFFGQSRTSSHILRIAEDGTPQALPQTIVQAVGDVETLWRETRDGREILWVGGSYGLVRVDLADAFLQPSEFRTVFGSIERTFEPDLRDGRFVWPHGRADFAVHFAATTYRSGTNLQFQNWLEGYDREWSSWSTSASREFTNLAAGQYRLRVRARDADGRIGQEAVLPFVVLPPWWQTGWAYAGYVVGGLLFVRGIVRWRVRAGERERERLQQLVAERTCQLAESQQSLLQAKEAAEAANRAKSAFLASMSHELRTPLNSVLGYAQILRRSAEIGPNSRRALDTIQRSGDHLLHLINEVLDLAKVEAGRVELQETPFSLGRFAQSITDLFAVRAAEKALTFRGPRIDDLPALVRGDESRLRQVLVNLLGNAFKFTERGSIQWAVSPAGPGRWRIEVSDTGAGIAPAEQAKVFEPFYQASSIPALAQQGTGLGLSISAQLVQLMGGDLQLESKIGKGSRFWFELPLPTVAAAAPVDIAPVEEPVRIVGYQGRRRRLLVVDDERLNRAILDEMLTPLGFVVEPADGAEAARAAVARQAPDAVLLDLRMPGDDGFVLAREWRATGALLGAKVLALSASVLPEQQAEALAAGCDAFLAKPFREEQLLRVLGSLLELDWLCSEIDQEAEASAEVSVSSLQWDAGILRRLLQLAEHGDALRLGQELATLARRGAAWAAAVAPWQKLAVGYQMETLSRALEDTLRRVASPESP
jgi:signal transduction histidine kinase/FixJ family two-component response regulator